MKIFIDTANLNEIKEAADMGNSRRSNNKSISVSKEGHKDFKSMLEKICEMVDGDISSGSCINNLR